MGKKILVIGDWVVDDHWVIGDHRSSKSVRTGQMHHRALHDQNDCIRAFCGAGKVASLLGQATELLDSDEPIFEIVGLGLWSLGDGNDLKSWFNPENTIGVNPYHLKKESKPAPENIIKLINIGKCLDPDNAPFGTTRIIRSYYRSGQKITQLQRLDWEIPAPYTADDGLPEWIRGDQYDIIDSELGKDRNDIKAVIIKDLGKGVMSKYIINWLKKHFLRIPWFVSTKSWKPNWLMKSGKLPIRLLLIPPVAAKSAKTVPEEIKERYVHSWITKNGQTTKEALESLKVFRTDLSSNDKFTTVVIPGDFNTLALHWDSKDHIAAKGVIQHSFKSEIQFELNMASIFFAAMINEILMDGNPDIDDLNVLIEKSLNYTYGWQLNESQRISLPKWQPSKSPKILGEESNGNIKNQIQIKTTCFSLEEELTDWEAALNHGKQGIMEDKVISGGKVFELWRAMVEVDGYICCVESKQRSIMKLVQAVDYFSRAHKFQRDRLKQNSCLLYAPVGTGKTSLVRKLAENNKLRFIPFNITQGMERNDILDCFDTIVTNYLQNPSEPLLIFIDEIDSKLGGEDAYSLFLSPLEDSIYIRGTMTFKLPACFWIFATTKGEEHIKKEGNKGEDFLSRMTHGVISLEDTSGSSSLENVYVAVAMILSAFPDVTYISNHILEVFYNYQKDTKLRELRHIVEAFENIQYGQVKLSNFPKKYEKNNTDGLDKTLARLRRQEEINIRIVV